MRDRSKKITIRVTEEELDTIQILVEKGVYDSVSAFVRTSLNLFIQSQMTPQFLKSVVVNIPVGLHDRCERLVQAGEASSVEAEIEKAFESHMQGKTERLLLEHSRMKKIEEHAMSREQRRSRINDLDRHFTP